MKKNLIKKVIGLLKDSGFRVVDCSSIRSSFDLFAKRERLLLIKILSNIESFSRGNAIELRRIASLMSGIPLLVGEYMKSVTLSNGIIYERYNTHVVNIETLQEIISGIMPAIHSVRGNYCVTVNSKLLREIRKNYHMTQKELAYRLNVSKQSIYRYEKTGRISLNIVGKLIDILNEDIIIPQEFPTSSGLPDERRTQFIGKLTDLKRIVMNELRGIGFEVLYTNAPFDIVADDILHDKRILTLVSNDTRRMRKKTEVIDEVSEVIGCYSACVSERNHDVNISVIKPRDLSNIKNPMELIDIIAEN